jgi:hypothetical protein
MANRYWVTGGTGNWNSTTNWSATTGGASGASVPGTADSARFDGASGSGTATLDISPTVQSLSFAPTTAFAGTFNFGSNTVTLNSTGTVFVGSTSMTVSGTPLIILTDTSATTRSLSPSAVTEANSISFRVNGGTGIFTLNNGSYRNIDFTDGTNPTGYAGALQNSSPNIYGNFKASTGMTKASGTGTFTFAATSGTKTINTASVTFDNPFTFNGVGGTFELQGALTLGATRTCTLTAGTLSLNGYTLTTGLFSSSNSNTRTLSFDNETQGFIYLTAVGTNTIYNASTSTNFTTVGSGNVYVTGAATAGTTRTITPGLLSSGGSISNALSFYIEAGSDTISLGTNPCVFSNLQFNTFTGTLAADAAPAVYGGLRLSNGMTITGGNNAWTFPAGVANSNLTILTSSVIDNPITFSGTTASISGTLTLGSTRALTLTNGTLLLTAGTTNTVGSFVTTGTTQKYLGSTVVGTQATISAASGTNTVTNLTIQDSNATGGATWDAYSLTNVNAGNNTGWFLPPTPTASNEITMRLRSFTQPRRF